MKKLYLFFAAFTLALSATAQNFTYNGIKYDVLSETAKTVQVGNNGDFTGAANIPVSVIYNNNSYSVISIASSAFFYCSSLTSITIPNSVTAIGGNAFAGCSGLTSIIIPNSVISIGNDAFSDCPGLKSVAIPNSVTVIGTNVFGACDKLTEINVESANPNFTSAEGVLFDKNKQTLIQYPAGKIKTDYTIPNSVTTIEKSAFIYSSGLKSVIFPNSLASIGQSAFYSCNNLTKIQCQAVAPPKLGVSVFRSVNTQTCVLEVPVGSKTAYQAADQWKDFKIINEVNFSNGVPSLQAQGIKISGGQGYLSITMPRSAEIAVSALNGSQVYKQRHSEGSNQISLPQGVYIVTINCASEKVIIRP